MFLKLGGSLACIDIGTKLFMDLVCSLVLRSYPILALRSVQLAFYALRRIFGLRVTIPLIWLFLYC